MTRKRYKVTIYTTVTGEEKGIHKRKEEEKTIQIVCDDCGRPITGMKVTESEYQKLMESNGYFICSRKSCDD